MNEMKIDPSNVCARILRLLSKRLNPEKAVKPNIKIWIRNRIFTNEMFYEVLFYYKWKMGFYFEYVIQLSKYSQTKIGYPTLKLLYTTENEL